MTMMVIIDMWNYTHFAGISVVDYLSENLTVAQVLTWPSYLGRSLDPILILDLQL